MTFLFIRPGRLSLPDGRQMMNIKMFNFGTDVVYLTHSLPAI